METPIYGTYYWWTGVIVILPLLISILLLAQYRFALRGNGWVLAISVIFSVAQAHPAIQKFYFLLGTGNPAEQTHAAPVFIALYLVFGKFYRPSRALLYAGTFLCLLATDLVDAYLRWTVAPPSWPFGLYLGSIGGAGWMDGLLHLPLLAVGLALLVQWEMNRGATFKWMLRRQNTDSLPS
jgi:hypothetical protein